MRTRARRTEQDVAALRADVSDLRNLATARLRVIDDLSERVVELEAVVYSLNTELARHIEFHPSPVAAVVDLAPVSDDVELGPPYDAGQPEPAAEEPDPEPAAEPQLTDEQAVRDTEANVVKRLAAELLSDEAMAAAWCSWASTDEDRNEDAWSGAVAAFIDRITD